MDIFDYVKDIEETYKFLLQRAKEENLDETQKYKTQQEKMMENIIKKKESLISEALKTLSDEIMQGIETYDNQINQAMENIKVNFLQNKETLIKTIIEQIGLEF